MKIAIIGGGFTGLTAAYELARSGHTVTVFEKEKTLGGLAHGFRESSWNWHLEYAYHHLFTNDHAILSLMRTLGLSDQIMVKRPITANYARGTTTQFDSPMHLLTYPHLSLTDKLRTGALLAYLKASPFWKPLERMTTRSMMRTFGGVPTWEHMWEPLMRGKFGDYADEVNAAWMWARITKRTPRLVYIDGGFHTLVTALSDAITDLDGTIRTDTTVSSVRKRNKRFAIGNRQFDAVLLTTPTAIATKLMRFPSSYTKKPLSIPHLHAQTLILETRKPVLHDTYWLNILEPSFPFMGVVAHTNFVSSSHYGGKHLTYIGNYLPYDHPYLSMKKRELYRTFLPYIKKINPTFSEQPTRMYQFTGPFAQPVHRTHYSRLAPKMHTPVDGVYLANMDSIYPWDRGTNYAVELGQKVARILSTGVQRRNNTS